MAEQNRSLLPGLRSCAPSTWRPPVDVYRCKDGWLVKCELAGVRREDIEVALSENSLRISGTRRDWAILEGHRIYSMEICYDRFERLVSLPCNLELAEITIEFRDGMLLVSLSTPDSSGANR